MKILIINLILHTAEKGVIPRHKSNRDCMIYTMARGFVANGHELTLIASDEYSPLEEESNSFQTIFFPSRLTKIFRPDLLPYPKGLLKWLKKNEKDFDLILSSETFSMGTLAASLVAPEKTVIWQELAEHQRFMKKLPSKIWYNFIARLFMKKTRAIGRSKRAKDFIAKYINKVSPEIVDHGCDSEKFHPDTSLAPTDSFIVVSQLIERKQPEKILAAFLKFIQKPEFSGYHLNIVGRGPLEVTLKEMVANAHAESNVTFHGFLSQKEFAPLSRRAKAMLVMTSRDLNMVSIPESIVNGTPVLTNAVPYAADFIRENNVGIVAENKAGSNAWDEDALAEAATRYEELHANCVRLSPTLTNIGCSERIIQLSREL